ncbi:type IV secretory system conjugative DNA transfer family protein [Carnobacterium divergens]|uniref:Type IV secretory system conjugative DNA transfer family protein n=2 Tax=Carnobacterium divergens TaxID=2748 RepID=A0AAW8RFQ5_CARDV|nr:type IV secretory system conjugative DNA transfer family protein [Carnobacterium divergens]MDT1958968.1 type IV secretory system conjugative DNA transfer family protein [Carnobacterium divergens]MDT1974936.1 type IV secretory system conjugative DNA transfer family protein [Carnobacterium divergens]
MKRKRKLSAKLKRNRHFRKFSLLKKRGYSIKGEDLPEETRKLNRIGLIGSFITFMGLFLIGNYLILSLKKMWPVVKTFFTSRFSLAEFEQKYDQMKPFQLSNMFQFKLTGFSLFLLISLSIIAAVYVYLKLSYRFKKLHHGQKGDNRLATLEEIMEQYHEIPDRKGAFKGIGGVPISHYDDHYYIDTDTINTCYLGVSRSGKGEMFVTILIDILSRAMIKCSMVLNDPKGELYAASKETLEKRGFNVQVLNILDPMQSMSYNPLQLIIDAWVQGDKATAQQLTNTLTFALYNDPNAGQNKFFNQAAQKAVNGIILALIEECEKTNEFEKVTMFNVGQMLNELGTTNWVDMETGQEKNGLDEYFNNLPQGNVAKSQYATTNFGSDKAKGNILATANEGLSIFQFETTGKMTSTNSFDLKSVGFPKTLQLKFSKDMLNKRMTVKFISAKNNRILGVESIKPNLQGIVNLNFNYNLETGDTIRITFRNKGKKEEAVYQVNRQLNPETKEYQRKVDMRLVLSTLTSLETVKMDYSDKPVAVFMITPDFDESMHVIASIFVKQLYTTLAQNASITRGKKCFRRVQFILDEFGNMPAIEAMDKIMTVCLGRNILFNIIVQSYSQLKGLYGDTAGDTIKENCQNHIYIMSGNMETIEEISKKVGRRTVEGRTSNDKQMEIENSHNRSAEEEYLITTERLSTLIEGETVVIRNLHRQDIKRKKIRPFPIFNTKETSMPYRWEFLSEDFDTDKDINSFDIPSEHTHLDLGELSIDFASWLDEDGVEFEIQEDLRTEQQTTTKIGELRSSILSILNKSNAPNDTIKLFMNSINESDRYTLEKLCQNISDPEVQSRISAYVSELIELQRTAA